MVQKCEPYHLILEIFTSASHDVEKDPAIMDHLFAEEFLVLNLFVRTNES